jgi:hypothetical protein
MTGEFVKNCHRRCLPDQGMARMQVNIEPDGCQLAACNLQLRCSVFLQVYEMAYE